MMWSSFTDQTVQTKMKEISSSILFCKQVIYLLLSTGSTQEDQIVQTWLKKVADWDVKHQILQTKTGQILNYEVFEANA